MSTKTNQENNQCDGCRKGMPIQEGIHYNNGKPDIYCQKKKYISHKENLREEWKKESTLAGANIPDFVSDWWTDRTIPTSSLLEMKEKIRGEKRNYEFPPSIFDEGAIDAVKNEGYNQALDLCIAMVEELIENNKK